MFVEGANMFTIVMVLDLKISVHYMLRSNNTLIILTDGVIKYWTL